MLPSVPWAAWFNEIYQTLAGLKLPRVIEDTHANRLANYPAASYPVGTLFWESDRTVTYINAVASTVQVWRFESGVMQSTSNTLSDIPSDLGTNDASFEVYNSFFKRQWIWTGAGFHYTDGVGAGAIVATSGAAPSGGLWVACDGTSVTTAEDGAGLGSRSSSDTRAVGGDNPFIQGGAGGAQASASPITSITVQSGTGVNVAADLAPNETNHGLPLRVSLVWWMRR
jgi:hypothetical protein